MARSMRGYFLRKLVYLFITILLIMTFNFILFRVMPGDPIRLLFPRGANPETLEEWRHLLGLDAPLFDQYINYMVGMFTGDWGVSFKFSQRTPILDIIPPFLMKTLFLSGVGTVLAIVLGVIYGRECAWRKGKLFDRIGSTVAVVFYSVPTFLFALFYIMLFVYFFPGWPLSGATSPDTYFSQMNIFEQIIDIAQHAFLPIMSLIIESLAGFALVVRSSLIDVLTEDYILTAEAKGLEGRDILKKHAMPNALLPVVAVIALNVGWIVGGTVMIEYIFTYKGIGYLSWEAVLGYDYPLLQAVFFLEIIAVLVANFIADILNFYLDPRVKI
jgi:peptide/nickel transport system permease protein